MESFSPQGRRAPEPFSVRLREGASPHLRRGAMAALRLRLSLGAPKAHLSQLWFREKTCPQVFTMMRPQILDIEYRLDIIIIKQL